MGLSTYNQKRNFSRTSEPKPVKKSSKTNQLSFVVQRHKASHLHYDFRLEMEGTLKSWAVPKGPSLNPSDKRLAMMVEDHPLEYAKFKGIIPEGNYGAGIVEIWDHGTYEPLEDMSRADAEKQLLKDLKKGSLKFRMHGKKLKGEFALVRMKTGEDNTWLLIKHKDTYATSQPYSSEEDTPVNSPINKWLEKNKGKKTSSKKKTISKPVKEPVKKSPPVS
jgi:bifunctional non-homologous end joining protein LigD